MKTSPLIGAVTLALLAGPTLISAHAAPKKAPPPVLLPLTERDMERITESGCNFAFDSPPPRTFVFAVNRTTLVRTPAGLAICTSPEVPFNAFSEGKGTVSCGGATLTLRQTGRGTAHPEADSATFPATLTVKRGGRTQLLRGRAGTAC